MPDWGYEPNKTPEPVMEHARKLAIIRLLRIYGGMTVPPSFLCLRNLDELFHNSLTSNVDMFVCEEVNNSSLSNSEYVTGISVMGCKQNSSSMKELEIVYSQAIRKDFTMNLELSGEISNICDKLIKHGNVSRVNSELLGIRSRDEKRIGVEELLGNSHLDISTHAYGILIPSNDILKRTAYQWFARMSGEQVLSSNTIIGKYILVANVPSAEKAIKRDDAEKPEWISYWEVPSDAPVWGVKPNFLGNHVQARSFQATSSTFEEPAVSFSQ